ncbi:MAG: transcription elongation factor GreA [Clostridia bacterium]|nr:transcription elongation factor GreA [Clostridia bacterium]
MDEKVFMSKEGLEEVKERLMYLKSVRRKEVAEKIAEARSYGDLSENSEYDIAREEQATVEAEIFELENKVKNVSIIDPKKINTSKVNIGCTVTVLNTKLNKEFVYKIVGDTESNPIQGIISNISPVGAGLIGKKVDEVAVIKTPGGIVNLKVVKIKA